MSAEEGVGQKILLREECPIDFLEAGENPPLTLATALRNVPDKERSTGVQLAREKRLARTQKTAEQRIEPPQPGAMRDSHSRRSLPLAYPMTNQRAKLCKVAVCKFLLQAARGYAIGVVKWLASSEPLE